MNLFVSKKTLIFIGIVYSIALFNIFMSLQYLFNFNILAYLRKSNNFIKTITQESNIELNLFYFRRLSEHLLGRSTLAPTKNSFIPEVKNNIHE